MSSPCAECIPSCHCLNTVTNTKIMMSCEFLIHLKAIQWIVLDNHVFIE